MKTHNHSSTNDIFLESREDAINVIEAMIERVETYGFVSVSDLYDLIGMTGKYSDHKYGWTNLIAADVVQDSEGFFLVLPAPVPEPIN